MKITAKDSRVLFGAALVAVVGGLARWSYTLSAAPFFEREKTERIESASLRARLTDARKAISEVRKMESDAESIRKQIDQLSQDIPAGPASIWLPALVKEHFANFGMSDPLVRMSTLREEPDLPGFRRGYWSVGVSLAETGHSAAGALLAVAELEQQYRLVKVLDFAIRPDPENAAGRVALFNLSALIRK